MMIGNISKFSWAEATSNDNGKTSGSGTIGIIAALVSLLCFTYGCILSSALIITNASWMFAGAAALLGVRKWNNNKSNNNTDEQENSGDKQ